MKTKTKKKNPNSISTKSLTFDTKKRIQSLSLPHQHTGYICICRPLRTSCSYYITFIILFYGLKEKKINKEAYVLYVSEVRVNK